MFEPIGGSAPKYTGKGVINPIAAICAAQLMLETLGETRAAAMVEAGVIKVLKNDLKGLGAGRMGYSTAEVGDLVAEHIEKIQTD
jgi:3-isopropylmalate dehydrogenase